MRQVEDPVSASKLLVDHALSRFSTDNLSCMIVRLNKEALVSTQNSKDLGVETENAPTKASEVDKIVETTKQKIADGSAPAVGVSPSNSGRGYDPVTAEGEDFVPTALDGTVLEEEPEAISDTESPEEEPEAEKPGATKSETKTEMKKGSESEAEKPAKS